MPKKNNLSNAAKNELNFQVLTAIENGDINRLVSLLQASEPKKASKKTSTPQTQDSINLNKAVDGIFPLHKAIEKNNVEIITLLLQKKANPNLKNTQNKTALQSVLETKDVNLIQPFLSINDVSISINQVNELLLSDDVIMNIKYVSKLIAKSCKNGKQFANLFMMQKNDPVRCEKIISALFSKKPNLLTPDYFADIITTTDNKNITLFMKLLNSQPTQEEGYFALLQSKLSEEQRKKNRFIYRGK